MIHSRIIQPEDANCPKDALHIDAENANVNSYNQAMLESIGNPIYYIKAIDNLPKKYFNTKNQGSVKLESK